MIKHFCKLTPMQKCISLLIILLSFNVYSEPRWQLYKNEQGVSIQYQEFSDDTFVVKGQLNIEDVTANDFLDLLSDIPFIEFEVMHNPNIFKKIFK